ncbi:thiamine transport system permease protein [Desulfobaculum xiamenense]|uniref:Thiamine transport system permease protein n=1 Tax=Desulfobaculum xiamenense TaxID=995050 RepID=A0A846QM26_9BACT|nr:iron ABC transporter permease [Desulfobaculum xiamenense]NJB66485.1 thiamine transport system permease protein [Desulfobaculum xiamenense]
MVGPSATEEQAIRLKPALLPALPPLLFLAVFYFHPLLSIFGLGLFPDGTFDTDRLRGLVASDYYLRTLWFTTWQAAASTALTLALATPAAYVFSHYEFPGRRILRTLTGIPFVLPTIVVAAAFRALLGPKGLVNETLMALFTLDAPPIRLDNTIWIILLAHVFYNFTVVLRIVGGFWSKLDPSLVEAARMLGASRLRAFREVTLPLLAPALITSGLLVFIFCFCSFGVILVLGGSRFATLEVAIYRQAVHIFNLPMAAALSLVQILFTFCLMWAYTWLQRRTGHRLRQSARPVARPCACLRERLAVVSQVAVVCVLAGLPLAALVLQSLRTPHGMGADFYETLFTTSESSLFFVPPMAAIGNSVAFATAALALALILGLCAAQALDKSSGRIGALLDPLFMLPLSTSAVTLGFGFIIALDEPPLDLRSSLALVPLAHALVAFPFVVRTILPVMRSIPANLREAAAMLGASPWRVWRLVDLPILGRAVAAAAVFAFTVSLGEFGATVFVARPQTPTMPLAIYRFLGQPGVLNYGQAMAMSSLLMLVTAAGFLVLETFTPREWGEF